MMIKADGNFGTEQEKDKKAICVEQAQSQDTLIEDRYIFY